MHVYCVWSVLMKSGRALALLELDVQMLVSCHIGIGNLIWVF